MCVCVCLAECCALLCCPRCVSERLVPASVRPAATHSAVVRDSPHSGLRCRLLPRLALDVVAVAVAVDGAAAVLGCAFAGPLGFSPLLSSALGFACLRRLLSPSRLLVFSRPTSELPSSTTCSPQLRARRTAPLAAHKRAVERTLCSGDSARRRSRSRLADVHSSTRRLQSATLARSLASGERGARAARVSAAREGVSERPLARQARSVCQ